MITPARILVVDDDRDIVRLVEASLHSQGYEIITASDGAMALEQATLRKPDLVISDVMMPGMDGWELVKQLRSRPQFGLIPVILLTALGGEVDRIRGFRLGADDYLPKPFHLGELAARVAKALKHRAQLRNIMRLKIASTRPPTSAGLLGSLDQIGLATVLGILDLERKTGTLTLSSDPDGRTGRVRMRDGRVVAVRSEGERTMTGESALEDLLEWGSGSFEFVVGEFAERPEIDLSTQQLLLSVARRVDETRRAASLAPPARTPSTELPAVNLDASDSIRPNRS